MSGIVSGTFSQPEGSGDAAWNAFRGLIAKAIRDYPGYSGRPAWSYGLDDLDFEDFVPELADFIMVTVTGRREP